MLPGMTTSQTPDTQSETRAPSIDEVLAELGRSGLSTAAFARARGLPPWKLYNALKARSRRAAKKAKSSALIPVRVKSPRRGPASPFELVLAGGHRLLVPEDFDADALRRLMGALAGC
jgi:hypothetical protein